MTKLEAYERERIERGWKIFLIIAAPFLVSLAVWAAYKGMSLMEYVGVVMQTISSVIVLGYFGCILAVILGLILAVASGRL